MRLLLPSVLALGACSREPEPTTAADAPEVQAPVHPSLAVDAPARYRFFPAGSAQIAGQLSPGSAPLGSLTVNGDAVVLGDDGSFVASLDLAPGINILSTRGEDTGGGRAVDGRAVYAGPLHDPGAVLPGAVRMQLGPELLDDDDPDLDDVAAIGESILADGDLADAFVGVPIETDFATITPTALSYDDVAIDIVPGSGDLEAAVILYDVQMDFETDWFGIGGSAMLDALTLTLTLEAEGSDVEAASSVVSLEGYVLEVDWVPEWLEDDLADWTVETLEEEIAGTAEETVSDLVGEYLAAFAVEAEVLDGVSLAVSLAEVAASPEGLQLTLDASVAGPSAGLPADAGSAATEGAPPDWPADASPFWVAADDDLLNQVAFAMWASGALGGFSYTGAELTALSGAELVPPLGPVDTVELGINMPPSLHPPTADDMSVDVGLGEWTMTFHRTDGVTLSFSVNARTGALVAFTDADEIALAMDNRPANMTVAVGTTEHPSALDPGDLAALIKLMVPPLLGNASDFLPGFALPPLDLGAVTPSLEGVALVPSDLSLSMTSDTWLVLDGDMAAP